MKKQRIRYLRERVNPSGKKYYFWIPGKSLRKEGWEDIPLGREYGPAATEAEKINQDVDNWRESGGSSKYTKAGTVGWLIYQYRASEEYKTKAPKTKEGYDTYLNRLEEFARNSAIRALTRQVIRAFCTAQGTDSSNHACYRTVRLLMSFAVDEGMIAVNPALKLRLPKAKARDKVWSDEHIETFVKKAIKLKRPSLALAIYLMAYTGQRRGDIARLTWSQYDGLKIRIRQRKTNAYVAIRCLPELKEALDRTKREAVQILINENTGKPYKTDVLSKAIRAVMNKAELSTKLQSRDLRRTVVVNLSRAKCNPQSVASITGHNIASVKDIIDTYCPPDDEMADNAIDQWEGYRNQKKRGIE